MVRRKPICGVYAIILNKLTKARYIGGSTNVHSRWVNHKYLLNLGLHDNRKLQQVWTKYGSNSFSFVLLETCDTSVLLEREQFWVDNYPFSVLLNLCPKSDTPTGVTRSEEFKAKVAATLTGRPCPLVTRLKISAAKLGSKHTLETKMKMRGRKLSAEHGSKISEANKKRVGMKYKTKGKKSNNVET